MPLITDPELQELDVVEQIEKRATELEDDFDYTPLPPQWQAPKLEEDVSPTIGETFDAAFSEENDIGAVVSYFNDKQGEEFTDEIDYNVFRDRENLIGYEDHLDEFDNVRSNSEREFIKRRIDTGRANRKIIDESGALGVAAMFSAVLLSPTILIPVAGTAYKATRAGTIVASTLRASGSVGAVEAGREVALHQLQPVRTLEESAFNVGGAMILSGILGGSVAALSKNDFNRIANDIDDWVDNEINVPQPEHELTVNGKFPTNDAPQHSDFFDEPLTVKQSDGIEATPIDADIPDIIEFDKVDDTDFTGEVAPLVDGDGGSAFNRSTDLAVPTLESETLVGGKFTEMLTIGPSGRLAQSPFLSARVVGRQIAEDPWLRKFHEQGIKSDVAVETLVKIRDAELEGVLLQSKAQWKAYSQRLSKNEAAYKNSSEFNEAVGRAMRRGDVHKVPEVESAAKYKRKGMERIKDDLIAAEKLPADTTVIGALSYLPRSYNREFIISDINNFRSGLEAQIFNNLSDDMKDYADDVVDEIINNILGNVTSGNRVISGGSLNKLKGRKLNISDEFLEPYLESNADILYKQYHQAMVPHIEFARKFRGRSIKDLKDDIEIDYNDISRVTKSGKPQTKLRKQFEQAIDDINAMEARLFHTQDTGMNRSGWASRTLATARKYNVTRMLGGVSISSLPDVARPIVIGGIAPYTGMIAKLATHPSWAKLKLEEMRPIAAALEITDAMHSRVGKMADITDDFVGGTKVERGVDYLSNLSSNVFLLPYHNSLWKTFSGLLIEDKIIRFAKGGMKQNDVQKLLLMGIDENAAARIAKQFDKYGEDVDGLTLGNYKDWDDESAKLLFESAITRGADQTINTPGIGTMPLMFDNDAAKSILQFKTFLVASHNQTLVAGLQQHDAAFATSVVTMVGMGTLVTQLKDIIAGREGAKTPEELLVEGVDRSGLFTMLFEANNMLDKQSSHRISLNAMIGANDARRFASRDKLQALFGPSAGILTDAAALLEVIGGKEITKGDVNRAVRTMPFNNLFYTRWVFNELKKGLNDNLGL